jgi:RNA polymerase sigma-70 factor (ECF subfamily)
LAALCRIYEKYRDGLLKVAAALLNDRSKVEDVFHDVFIRFSQTVGRFELKGSLRGYLSICVANHARDINRMGQRRSTIGLGDSDQYPAREIDPERGALQHELTARIETALAELPEEQREVLVLHLQSELSFRQIARLKEISINTVQSRYRYGLEKIRSSLDGSGNHAQLARD